MIEEVVIGLTITIVGTILISIFRIRQLYIVIPRLFPKTLLSADSNIVELRVFNRSKFMEEDVIIKLNANYEYEIIATTLDEISMNDKKIFIPRLSPTDEHSVLMLIENAHFKEDDILSITSKTTKGKLFKLLQDIPPNYGKLLLSILILISLIIAPLLSINFYFKYKEINEIENKRIQIEKLSFLKKEGWQDFDIYATSELNKLYIDGEFPIYQNSIERVENSIFIDFIIINKTAKKMEVTIRLDNPYANLNPDIFQRLKIPIEFIDIEPMGTKKLRLSIYWPKKEVDKLPIDFSINSGNESFYLKKIVNMNK